MTPKVRLAAPASLREALTLSYQHKSGVRWFYGTGEILPFDYSQVPADAGLIIDARAIPECSAVVADSSVRFGAFTPRSVVAAHPALAEIPVLRGAQWSLAQLCALDARVTVLAEGQIREIEVLRLFGGHAPVRLAAHELPLQIVVPRPGAHAALVERRRTTSDGAASFDQRVAVSMALAAGGRTAHVRIIAHLIGEALVRVRAAEAKLQHVKPTRELAALAAAEAAKLFAADDKKTSAALRSLPPMVLAALNEAIKAVRRP